MIKDYCGQAARGAIGDCVRKPGHKGVHADAAGHMFDRETLRWDGSHKRRLPADLDAADEE